MWLFLFAQVLWIGCVTVSECSFGEARPVPGMSVLSVKLLLVLRLVCSCGKFVGSHTLHWSLVNVRVLRDSRITGGSDLTLVSAV